MIYHGLSPHRAPIHQKILALRPICIHLLVIFTGFMLFSCQGGAQKESEEAIKVWFHTGRPEETVVFEQQVAEFNRRQSEITVKLTLIPEGDYNTQVQAAAADNKLPDILDLDGPYLYNYVWKGHLIPLDDLLPDSVKADLLASIIKQGTYHGKLYSVGTFDSGLGLYGNRRLLELVNARIPQRPDEAWTAEEFSEILHKLAEQDDDGRVLDLRLDYRGEWFTYAFSPLLQSAGADLIDRSDFRHASGTLNNKAAIRALTQLQEWLAADLVDANIDTASFTQERTALSWCGHWEYPRYSAKLDDDLVIMPLPDFGTGSRTGMGSWNWAITKKCRKPEYAARFLRFLLEKEQVTAMCKANGAVPATKSAVEASKLYGPDGALHLFVLQLEQTAVPRPRTPAYPIITSSFQEAFQSIRNLGDVKSALDKAAAIIDRDIEDNLGYPDLDR